MRKTLSNSSFRWDGSGSNVPDLRRNTQVDKNLHVSKILKMKDLSRVLLEATVIENNSYRVPSRFRI